MWIVIRLFSPSLCPSLYSIPSCLSSPRYSNHNMRTASPWWGGFSTYLTLTTNATLHNGIDSNNNSVRAVDGDVRTQNERAYVCGRGHGLTLLRVRFCWTSKYDRQLTNSTQISSVCATSVASASLPPILATCYSTTSIHFFTAYQNANSQLQLKGLPSLLLRSDKQLQHLSVLVLLWQAASCQQQISS